MIRSQVLSVLKSASSQVQAAIRGSGSSKASFSEGFEASVIYVRFKAAASEIKPILDENESRSSRKEYVQILSECHRLYCKQRLSLIKSIVQHRITEFSRKEALPSLTRSGCAYLMQVCQLEHQLFDHFFPSSSKEVSSFAPLIDPLCTYLYDTLRPKLIHEGNLDTLCELADILKVEVLGEQLSRHIESLAGLRPTLQRILADIHERLTFCARTHIHDQVDDNSDIFKTWYPLLEKTVSCLSKLYHCLEPSVFTGLAQEAVQFCSVSIQNASKLVAKRSSTMDGQLFLVKPLLIMREQIAPFDIEFSVIHKELDFSHLLEHLRRVLRGQASLFDWSRLTSLARGFSPRVLESQIDARKVTAVKGALSSGRQDQKVNSVLAKPLKDLAFATPDKVAELIQKVSIAIRQDLPNVMSKMQLYLQNPSTRMILFKPIKTNIVEAYVQLQSLIKSDSSAEEMQSIGMVSMQDLQAQLDMA